MTIMDDKKIVDPANFFRHYNIAKVWGLQKTESLTLILRKHFRSCYIGKGNTKTAKALAQHRSQENKHCRRL